MLLRAILRVVGISVMLVVAYFAAPIGQDADGLGLVLLVVGSAGFVGLVWFQIVRIIDSPLPQLRAAEALATVVLVVIVGFALLYVAMSTSDPSGFSEPMTKVNGLYFTVTVLATVGFGDITAASDGARLVVTVQMLIDLLIVGVLVKIIIGASRIGVERRRAEAEASTPSDSPPDAASPGEPG
jgi:voltage-gated potassium channel